MTLADRNDLGARREALDISHNVMAMGIGLSPMEILSIEARVPIDGHERTDFYIYWLARLERLTREQLALQVTHAQEGRRFR